MRVFYCLFETSTLTVHLPLKLSGPAVSFMLSRIQTETGVQVSPQHHIQCMPCDLTRAGGYNPDTGSILLCAGNFGGKKYMEDTLAHELVHMYDDCKFKVDWRNLRHHACSEVG